MRARSLVSRGIAVLVATVAVLLGLSGTGSAAAGTQMESAGVGLIRNIGSGNGCMDLQSYASGTPVTLYRCNSSTESQRFDIKGDGTIHSFHTGFCMDISSYTAGAVVHMKPCHHGTSQQWNNWGDTIYSWGNPALCMDLSSYNNGTPVTLAPCGSQNSQRWAW
ncbi:RICIN domain-containing protein [Kibdelosporangium philippinense]|uniref:RICIN domain-containing protein n=1 Tax=Kibdelosporangium philippinense TaxID=211113 RepID=A0ABS8ZK49_9PSEU|nr:RICIN domain-containing protein [Kibdelosporangium philippinense]MCE7008183.1 RICIN domain-containing protein [Kibdelosporangium philippinense]